MTTLEIADQRGNRNNFTILRLVGAAMVLWGHSFGVVGSPPLADPFTRLVGGATWSGEVGVGLFFTVSGFLVLRSLDQGSGLLRFARARVLRIVPGLAVANALTILVCWAVFVRGNAWAYLASPGVRDFFLYNTFLFEDVRPFLPGVFTSHPHAFANGSLWTLPAEVRLYAGLFLLGSLGVLGRKKWSYEPAIYRRIATTVVVALLALALTKFDAFPLLGHNNRYGPPAQLFLMGMLFYLQRDRIVLDRQAFAAALVLLLVTTRAPAYFHYATLVAYPYVALYVAYGLPYLGRINEVGDCSYGLYVYAWPVQQLVFSAHRPMSPYVNIAISFTLTMILAALSWRFVEKPAIDLKDATFGRRFVSRRAVTKGPAQE